MLPSRRRNRFLDSCLRFLTPAPFPSAPSHARTFAEMVALCTARTRPAPRNNRASTINHAKTRTAWRTGDWGCGHACTGRERGHQAAHARAGFSPTGASYYQRKQKINRQSHENGEETGRVNPSHGETRETRYDFLYTIGKPMSSATSSRCPRSNRTVFTTHKNVFPV